MDRFLGGTSGGTEIQLFYNQAALPSGEADHGVAHYLDAGGRMRPDIVVKVVKQNVLVTAFVVKCKNSENADYLVKGYRKAVLYRWEYQGYLRTGPCAVLVASNKQMGPPRKSDDVVASGWQTWPQSEIIDGIVSSAG